MRDPQGTANTDDKNELAKDRTDWAEDRTLLANERTFAGWMRTGMAAVALALGLRAIFGEAEPVWLPKTVATLFLAIAIVIFWSARIQAGKAQRRLDDHHAEAQPVHLFTLMASVFSFAAVAVGYVLWTL
ncbi:DUF202 domain-containing protein [Jannaschia sp. Os4]|uniref:YidH family protein n=1 Tax=Jannaschia sp. Os4 TaxID=2807617 RepID=UPI00193A6497|nr:DUF202 domain-containing protein [Jannaschia sp. Os4]MBM2574981.1 DUF202 domain-containing protein [Jannaschia sp. Os4]